MQIKQNATRAATWCGSCWLLAPPDLAPQVLDLGDALSDLTMLLRRLIGENVKLDLVMAATSGRSRPTSRSSSR